MKIINRLSVLALSLLAYVGAFTLVTPQFRTTTLSLSPHEDDAMNHDESVRQVDPTLARRNFLGASLASLGAWTLLPRDSWADDNAPRTPKVLVLGGTGLVGSRVVELLQSQGIATVATSRDGRGGTVALDFTMADHLSKTVADLAQDCTAVISCVGAIGTPNDQVINQGTGVAALAAKEVGVQQFVYITVAPEVKEFAKDIAFLQDYMKGKGYSRDTVLSTFPQTSTLIEPTFIYGGDEFAINPPRVAGFYGEFIEGLLGSSPVRAVEGVMPPGILKIALEPPISADAVAGAAVAGALGKSSTAILDSHDKIKAASTLL